jgi:pilus assembly protein CpaB
VTVRKLNVTIIAGLIVALIGAGAVYAYGHKVDSRVASGKQTVAVLVAKADLPAGTSAAAVAQNVQARQVPSAYVAADALSAPAQIPVGAVLTGPVTKGSQLTRSAFAAAGTPEAVKPTPGTVDIAISVGLIPGALRYIAPGSGVDLFYTSKSVPVTTKLFASGIRVVSVNAATPAAASGQAQQAAAAQPAPTDQVYALLEVTPDLAQQIVTAQATGTIYLGVSNPGEQHQTPAGSTADDVLGANK